MKLLVAFIVLSVAGCATAPPTGKVPQPAEEAKMANCRYIDTIAGTSMLYGMFAGTALENARSEVLREAGNRGATHVVWQPLAQSYGGSQVFAKAYVCP